MFKQRFIFSSIFVVLLILSFIVAFGSGIRQQAAPESQAEEVQEEDAVEEGAYEGTAEGYGGQLKVEVSVEEEIIKDIKVIEHSETERLADPAFEELIENMKDEASPYVDTVSGATATSEAFIKAVEQALISSCWMPEDAKRFRGSAEGYGGELVLDVIKVEDEIRGIKIVASQETDRIADPAFEKLIAAVVDTQDSQVDTISGATVTSEAFREAVEEALTENKQIVQNQVEGYGGEMVVEVIFANGEITDIKAVEHSETERLFAPAFEELTANIIEEQTTEVDTISGATVSSEAVIEAVEMAKASL